MLLYCCLSCLGGSLDVGLDPGGERCGGDAHPVDVGVLKATRLLIQELRHLEIEAPKKNKERGET